MACIVITLNFFCKRDPILQTSLRMHVFSRIHCRKTADGPPRVAPFDWPNLRPRECCLPRVHRGVVDGRPRALQHLRALRVDLRADLDAVRLCVAFDHGEQQAEVLEILCVCAMPLLHVKSRELAN